MSASKQYTSATLKASWMVHNQVHQSSKNPTIVSNTWLINQPQKPTATQEIVIYCYSVVVFIADSVGRGILDVLGLIDVCLGDMNF